MYSISYDEVKKYVESLPEDTSQVGKTCDSQKCIIANAVLDKYTEAATVWVEPAKHIEKWIRLFFIDSCGEARWVPVETGEDEERLRNLANSFDRLDGRIWSYCPTKAYTLKELF
jgi:hypothetical protein